MAFGLDDIIAEGLKIINKYIPDPEQRAQAEAEHQQAVLSIYQIEKEDRDGARQREIGTKDKVNRNLAYIIIIAFIVMVTVTLAGWSKVDTVLAGTLIGYLSAKAEQVLSYYFGSTHNSRSKDDTIYNMIKK